MLKHSNVHNITYNEPESSINALARIIRREIIPIRLACAGAQGKKAGRKKEKSQDARSLA